MSTNNKHKISYSISVKQLWIRLLTYCNSEHSESMFDWLAMICLSLKCCRSCSIFHWPAVDYEVERLWTTPNNHMEKPGIHAGQKFVYEERTVQLYFFSPVQSPYTHLLPLNPCILAGPKLMLKACCKMNFYLCAIKTQWPWIWTRIPLKQSVSGVLSVIRLLASVDIFKQSVLSIRNNLH